MRNKIAISIAIAVLFCINVYIINAGDPNTVVTAEIAEPNLPTPRQIVMPKDTKMPPRFRCPVHGIVTNNLLNLEIDRVVHTYCKKCAMQLVVDIFNENLPEVTNESP